MRGLAAFAGIAVLVFVAIWAYRVNYATQAAENDVARLQRQIRAEREAISVLRAEWAYLNRPERLLALSEENFGTLQLMPLSASNYADPMKITYPEQADPLAPASLHASTPAPAQGGNP